MPTLIDLSYPINNLMPVYPGDESLRLEKINDIAQDGFTQFRLSTGMHAGTHIDGPMHLIHSKIFLSEIPIEQFIGQGCLLNVESESIIQRKPEYGRLIKENSIVLLHTGFDRMFGRKEYYCKYPTVSKELAQLLIEKNVKMICLDSPSPDREPFEIHKLLLENGVLIAENLTNMGKLISAKKFEVIALPLNIRADSSLARIVAKILE
jgi:kynurenine formamidase